MDFVLCSDCMLRSIGKPFRPTCPYQPARKRKSGGFGCTAGLSIHEVEAEQYRRASEKLLNWRNLNQYSWLPLFNLREEAKQEERKFVSSAKVLSKPHPVPSMTTFLCEECAKAVQVPSDMLGDELRFKCFVCHKENHYDLTD